MIINSNEPIEILDESGCGAGGCIVRPSAFLEAVEKLNAYRSNINALRMAVKAKDKYRIAAAIRELLREE